jgi:1-deoxy-D-xylulose-5-phosphate reductoisomerase
VNIPRQRVTVLGSTGSVGVSTLDVIARHPDRFEVFALSAATRVDELLAQCAQFSPRFAVMASAPHAIRCWLKNSSKATCTTVVLTNAMLLKR